MKVQFNKTEWYPVIVPGHSRQLDKDNKPKEYEVTEEVWKRYVETYEAFSSAWHALLDDLAIF